jgi:hypothetical protein
MVMSYSTKYGLGTSGPEEALEAAAHNNFAHEDFHATIEMENHEIDSRRDGFTLTVVFSAEGSPSITDRKVIRIPDWNKPNHLFELLAAMKFSILPRLYPRDRQ